MRVAVDAENLAQDRRGMGRHVRTILAGMPEHGIDATLVCRTERAKAQLQELMPRAQLTNVHDAKRNSYDAAWFPWNGMRFDLGVPSVLTIHDLFAFEEPHANFVARYREQRPISRGVQRATAIAAVSRWTAQRIEQRFSLHGKPVTVVPPILESFWKPRIEPARDPFVVFVAGPERRKNAAMLFESFERAFPNREVRLVIVGSLSPRDEVTLATKMFKSERATATDEQLATLYSQALAVAVPSLSEGYGLVALEAMACGAPVLASNAAALPEACGDAALLLDPHDIGAWTNALQRAARDPALRDNLRARSMQRASEIDRGAPARTMAALLLSLR